VRIVSPASGRIKDNGAVPPDRAAGNDVAAGAVDFHDKIKGFVRWANTKLKGRKNL
jgi:hypothetical protein